MAGNFVYGALDLSSGPYLVDFDGDLGSGQVETQTISRLLLDGDVVSGQRTANRTVKVIVEIASDSRADFAAAEIALALEADKSSNTLLLLFGAGDGLPVVLDTYRAQLEPTYDAISDYSYFRQYTLTIPAAPFTRPDVPTTLAPSLVNATVLDALDATTGVTLGQITPSTGGSLSVDTGFAVQGSGSLKVTTTGTGGINHSRGIEYTLTKTITQTDLSGFGSVSLAVAMDKIGEYAHSNGVWQITLTDVAGKTATYYSQTVTYPRPATQFQIVSWPLSTAFGGSVQSGYDSTKVVKWSLHHTVWAINATGAPHVWHDSLMLYGAGTPPQTGPYSVQYFAGVLGAARTPISLQVQALSSGARRLLVSRFPNPPAGFNPILTVPNATNNGSGGSQTPTTDTLALSGRYYQFSSTALGRTITYRIPALSVNGAYTLVGRMATNAGTFSITFAVTATVTGSSNSVTTTTILNPTATYGFYNLAALQLPTPAVSPKNTTATLDITIQATAAGGAVKLDDALYLCDRAGESILIDQPSGTSSTYFWVDAPNPNQFLGTVYTGTASDRSDALSASAYTTGPESLQFDPGFNSLLVVCDQSSAGVSTTLTYFPRYLSERAS